MNLLARCSLLIRGVNSVPTTATQLLCCRGLRMRGQLPPTDFTRPNSVNMGRAFAGIKKTEEAEFLKYNKVIYPPRDPGEPARPAEVCNVLTSIDYSRKKLWCLGHMVQGMSVEEALKQLAFRPEKGARFLEEALHDTIEMAVKEHHVEFSTNLWVESARVVRGDRFPCLYKGPRRNYHKRVYHYSNLHIRLREGRPPRYMHDSQMPQNGYKYMSDQLDEYRRRRIFLGL